eukprot:SAG31_NODE_1042_length_10187_cov_54.452121_4_plen_104_part_00
MRNRFELRYLEEARDVTVVKLLIRAARWQLLDIPSADIMAAQVQTAPAAAAISAASSLGATNVAPVQMQREELVDVPTLVRLHHGLLVEFLAGELEHPHMHLP